MNVDDTRERLATLEEQVRSLRLASDDIARRSAALAVAEMRSYVEHAVSDNGKQIRCISDIVIGTTGDNGLRSHVIRQRWLIRIQWAVIAMISSTVLGMRLPMLS